MAMMTEECQISDGFSRIKALGNQKTFLVPTPVLEGAREVVAFFGSGVECQGEICYEGSVQIDGKLEGTIRTQGTLMLGDQATVKANIEAGRIICKGSIQGDVVAREKIQLLSPGYIDGTLTTPQLSVEPGGMFNGRVAMGQENKTVKS